MIATAIALAAGTASCARSHALVATRPADELATRAASGIAWYAPDAAADLAALDSWRRAVGPPLVLPGTAATPHAARLVIVNWNVHVGAGDVSSLLDDVRREMGAGVPIVLLLQEAYRRGPDVPVTLDPAVRFASAIQARGRDDGRQPIEAVAASHGLHAFYVPSMRNGGPLASDEDRGNAILSTLPLTNLEAIELPFEKQRRVAIGAMVGGVSAGGSPWRLRVVSAHFDTIGGARRLWVAGGEFARARQARGLVTALDGDTSTVLGADLNSWFGFRDAAYVATARAFPDTRVTDRRPTFRGILRLDHLFFRLDDGWAASFRRADGTYGSDHYPLIGTIDFGSLPQ